MTGPSKAPAVKQPWLPLAGLMVVALAAALIFLAVGGGGRADDAEAVVRIQSATGEHVFDVELVDTDETRARGLMFRDHLAPDAGMLFDFFEERPVSFWMQNTLIPLDMLFIRADGTVARVHDQARPLDTSPIPSGEPVRFVLEIPGGRAAELGIAAGDVMVHPRVEAAD